MSQITYHTTNESVGPEDGLVLGIPIMEDVPVPLKSICAIPVPIPVAINGKATPDPIDPVIVPNKIDIKVIGFEIDI